MRKICLITALTLLSAGLLIFVWDTYTHFYYGFHMNEVAAISDEGEPIDWPTGERPAFMLIPIIDYAIGLWIVAVGAFWLQFKFKRQYEGRIFRGTG